MIDYWRRAGLLDQEFLRGLGNIYGAIVGGILFGLLETFAAAVLPYGAENKRVFAFLIVILFLVFRPTGILGEKTFERV